MRETSKGQAFGFLFFTFFIWGSVYVAGKLIAAYGTEKKVTILELRQNPDPDIAALAGYNIAKVRQVAERILDLCREPLSFETILQRLFTGCGLTMDFQQYVLVGSTVRSYLSWLKDTGSLDARVEDDRLLWERK